MLNIYAISLSRMLEFEILEIWDAMRTTAAGSDLNLEALFTRLLSRELFTTLEVFLL